MMGNALKMDKKTTLLGLFNLGWSNRSISKETGIHRTTVKRYRQKFQSVPKVPTDFAPCDGQSVPKVPADFVPCDGQSVPKVPTDLLPSSEEILPEPEEDKLPRTNSLVLLPHRSFIRDEIALGLTAQRVYQDMVERFGYTGSYDSVKRYASKLRTALPKWFERLPTFPGREAQVDFGLAPCLVLKDGKYRRPWVFKMTLSHSRYAYEELVWHQDTETWIRCHERAFRFFNGVPQTIKLDNLKAGVIKPCIYDSALNEVYAAYGRHAGFVPLPCQPYQPNQKGRVEHDVGYTKSNGLAEKRFESLEDGNIALRSWNKRWASTRIHGTTRVQVRRMFDETERDALQPLPRSAFSIFIIGTRKVDVTGCIAINRNFYSVPHTYVGKEVIVHFSKDRVKVLDAKTQALLIEHRTMVGKNKLTFTEECKPPYANKQKEQQELYYVRQAAAIGRNCECLVEHFLMADEYRGILRTRGILNLAKTFDSSIMEEACRDAMQFNRKSYTEIKALCQGIKSERSIFPVPKLSQSHECIREVNEYQNYFNRMVEQV